MIESTDTASVEPPMFWPGKACEDQPTEWFFALPLERQDPVPGESRNEQKIRWVAQTRVAWRDHAKALGVCGRCPVVATCLTWGMEMEDHGVWGGLSSWERYALGGRGRPWSRRAPQTSEEVREEVLGRITRHSTIEQIEAVLDRFEDFIPGEEDVA